MMHMTQWVECLVWRELAAGFVLLLCMCVASPVRASGEDATEDTPAVHAEVVGSAASVAPGADEGESPESGKAEKAARAHETKDEPASEPKAKTGYGATVESGQESRTGPGQATKDGPGQEAGSKPHFNMDVLIERLKKCDVIGVFTKLTLRSDALDLVDEVQAWHKHKDHVTISDIRARFDGLLLKVLALLDDDPALSTDISMAREDIWRSLLEVKA